jgi:hypothetical protein
MTPPAEPSKQQPAPTAEKQAGPQPKETGPPAKAKPAPPAPPLWRQAFDAAEKAVTPRAESLVRTDEFMVGAALLRKAQGLAAESARGLTARAWHLINLPAGSDVKRLRAQIGALDREVRRLGLQLEAERRRSPGSTPRTSTNESAAEPATEETHAHGAQSAERSGPRPPRRRTQRPASP